MRLLVVGHGAREHALVRRFKAEGVTVVSIAARPNLGLEAEADVHRRVAEYDPEEVVALAKELDVGIVFPTHEATLRAGLVDVAATAGLSVLGLTRLETELEWDRSLARSLLASDRPLAVPRIVRDHTKLSTLRRYFEHRQELVLKEDSASAYRRILLPQHAAEVSWSSLETEWDVPFTVEEFVHGGTFVVPFIYNDRSIAFGPAIRDYPFRHAGNRGRKTGGMGSAATCTSDFGVVSSESEDAAHELIEVLLWRARRHFGRLSPACLAAQFAGSEVKFLELDVRPGDPELITQLALTKSSMADVVSAATDGSTVQLEHEALAAVTISLVPEGYPELEQPVALELVPATFASPHVVVGCVGIKDGVTLAGPGRALAVTAMAPALADARDMARSLANTWAPLSYRVDVGE